MIQLGKTQFGQQVALYVDSMGGNVQQLGHSLREQGKTLNQAYTDSMNAAFQDLGGKTKASWAQAEQVMASGLDKYYTDMRQTTTRDYDSIRQITSQLINDGYNHRTDLEKQDQQKFLTVVQQYMTDSNNGLIDTSKGNINKLSHDMAQYFKDMASGNSTAVAADIRQLGKDTEGDIGRMYDNVDAYQSHRFDQEIAKAQSDIARISNEVNSDPLGALGHATGGLITGPGTGTSDSILARLSNGEFVVNAKSTAAYRPLLEAINNRFATGGYVDPVAPRALGDQKFYVETLSLMSAMQRAQGALAGAGAGVQGKWAGSVAQWIQQAMTIDRVSGADWFSGLEIIIGHESGGNPNAINLSDSNAAAGDPSRGLMQTIGSTFAAYHAPGTSTNIYDPVANIAAGIRYIESVYHGIDNVPGVRSVRGGGAYLPYDNGGWLPPSGMPVNGLRKPEAVLTPEESQAFVQIVRQLTAQGAPGQTLGSRQATINFYGTQLPNAEQKAGMMRELALALGGG
ncbi:transglycosylase SLT domain-containing protein [Streptomyces sp. NPDC001118]